MISRPSARAGHAMAYDSESDRVILFGGRGPAVGSETWSFDVNTNTWMRMGATGPSARYGTAMVYVPGLDRVILFGGFDSSTGNPSGETWAYNYNADAWTRLPASNSPSPRGIPSLAYDSASGQIILFGGNTGVVPNNETWSYDPQTLTWTQMNPTIGPSARERYDLVYVSTLDLILLFGGGTTGMITGLRNNETWTYDFDSDTWTEMNPAQAPSARQGHRMVYDTAADRVILFGGDRGNNETWAYDPGTNAWTPLDPALAPSGRMVHRMAYDIESDRAVLFGGEWPFDGVANDETWAYDTDANEWILLDVSTRPSSRSGHGIVYDLKSDRIVLFSGWAGSAPMDTWTYDFEGNQWALANPAAQPPVSDSFAMAYDAQSGRAILFGGYRYTSGVASAETWSYDLSNDTWTNRNPVISPPRRWGARAVYDAAFDRMILFGGHDEQPGSCLSDTWSYDFESNTWTERTPASSPSARAWQAMAYDSESRRVVLFGGDPCTGASSGDDFNDTWAYDFANDTWANMNPVSSPIRNRLSSMAYDLGSDRIVLFGGVTGPRETWTYNLNGNVWTQMPAAEPRPSDRNFHAMAYNSQSDRVVLFGGSWPPIVPIDDPRITHNNDTWAYDFDTNTWTPMIVPPSVPQGLAATPSANLVDLTWSAPAFEGSHPLSGYRIYRAIVGQPIGVLAEVGPIVAYPDTNVTEGVNYLYEVAAVNAAGEGARSNQASAVVPDVSNPSIVISSPAVGAILGSQAVRVSGTATDTVALDKVELSSDGTVWIAATGTTSWSGIITLPEGPNTIRARATDSSGNQAEATVAVAVDVTPPTVGITTLNFPVGTATISGTAADNLGIAKVEVSMDDVNWVVADGTTSWSVTLTLPAESFTLYARATDTAGSVGAIVALHIDRPPPLNVFLLAGIAGAVAAAGVGVFLLLRRRRRR